MSTPGQSNSGKRKSSLINNSNSPFQQLTRRTVETGNEALREARQIDITKIETNSRQPRRTFDEDRLKELAADIEERGILQPPIVRPIPDSDDRYEIVVGERRYQAARMIGLKSIPVLVKELDDRQAEVTSLVENIQREDLTITDEVNYFNMLKDKYGLSMREIAEEVAHKSHTYVETRLNLALNPDILKEVEAKKIGLQEAVQRMRARQSVRKQLAHTQDLLGSSQSVIANDTSLKNAQSRSNALKLPKGLSRPFSNMARDIKVVARQIERVGGDDKGVVLEQIEILEKEITDLKKQLKAR